MENLYWAEERGDKGSFPEVILDAEKEYVSFEGDCNPEDTDAFFEPIFTWITQFLQTEGRKVIFRYKMSFVHDPSLRYMQKLFNTLGKYQSSGKGSVFLSLHAVFSDTDAQDDIESFTEHLDCPREIVLHDNF